ncbi:DNA mismatch repair protein MutS [Bilifractor sp. LCP19S3_H10]|uniref:DNA mismatch repair protein MutS n=1 Tax=Bilifractor sp. LCP19S3_H10 TaxID=3438736 RepID=UPI003F8FB3DD
MKERFLSKMALSPMMQNYLATKEEYKDCVLFYRVGDFYEMFYDDAKMVSEELELTLTGKECGLEERAPMCGIPFHAADTYITKLIALGHKVAICEQVEDPKLAKGLVKREVIRVVTPGTVISQEELDETRNNYLMCIVCTSDRYGMSIADISTGQCLVSETDTAQKLKDEIQKFMPSEIICNQSLMVSGLDLEDLRTRLRISVSALDDYYFDDDSCQKILKKHFHVSSLKGLGLDDFSCGTIAAGALFQYLYETQKNNMEQMTSITPYFSDRFMLLDSSTRRNLELVETLREKQKKGSLLGVLDRTKTAMGARMLRSIIEQPLINKEEIEKRLTAVEELTGMPMIRDEIREYLQPVYDLERLSSRIAYQTANPRDLIAFKSSLQMLPFIRQLLTGFQGDLLKNVQNDLDPLEDLFHAIDDAIIDDPPMAMKDGGIIKDGYNEQVDKYRAAKKDGQKWLSDLEAEEREKTGIRTLRVKYSRVFGYCIEVTNSFKDKVPDYYQRKQTLTGSERYSTDKLRQIEEQITGAEDRLGSLEYELFSDIRDTIGKNVARVQRTARAIACLDVFCSFSYVAERNRYVRPKLNKSGKIDIQDGRHPVVEKMIPDDLFISNDTYLDQQEHRVAIITGPNMAGKSTYMRQTALIVLMAQIGSFVPASSANIGLVDRIFTRVGASDDLASGQSTFMVEMSEVANILRNATSDSLLILDEIGRGTSTFDGLSLAWAITEFVADPRKIGAKTLFATHFHELTELEGKIAGVNNYCVAVKEKGDGIVFLRKIVKGGADKSYGIQVARLAGVPEAVLARAKEILDQLSDADITAAIKNLTESRAKKSRPRHYDTVDMQQMSLFDTTDNDKIINEIREIDISTMTPLDALNMLNHLQNEVKNRW